MSISEKTERRFWELCVIKYDTNDHMYSVRGQKCSDRDRKKIQRSLNKRNSQKR